MREVAFLSFLAMGLVLLLSGSFWARVHWRGDIEAYGRSTSWLKLLFHPERFVTGSAVGVVKRLYVGGTICLGLAVGLVVYEIVLVTLAQWQMLNSTLSLFHGLFAVVDETLPVAEDLLLFVGTTLSVLQGLGLNGVNQPYSISSTGSAVWLLLINFSLRGSQYQAAFASPVTLFILN